jgi:N-acetylmuramic acid 6-phosphate etherase
MIKPENTTESDSQHDNLEQKSVGELLQLIHAEDHNVLPAIKKVIPDIEQFVEKLTERMRRGGRLFYVGAGTSGRLGVVDASEIPPTFGVGHGIVIGLIAGGDGAIRKAVEHAEDNELQGWKDILAFRPNNQDTVMGIAASGRTPYVIGAVKEARMNGLLTGCITCNHDSKLASEAEYPIEVVVGPEFITGSTRMKSGTAQKLVLNMITTTVMIQLGRVRGNKMVDMQLTNQKLIERGTRMIANELNIEPEQAKSLLLLHGSVREAIDNFRND